MPGQHSVTAPAPTNTFRAAPAPLLVDSASSTPAVAYSSFWTRSFAAAIDFAVLALLVGVVASFYSVAHRVPKQFAELYPGEAPRQIIRIFGARFLFVLLGLYILCNWLYFAISESSLWQATLGKRILGLHIADCEGRRVTFGRASARFLGGRLLLHLPAIGIPYFLLDCVFAAFPPRKQAIHDRLARCLVVKRPSSLDTT